LTPRSDELAILLERSDSGKGEWVLPWEAPADVEGLDDIARELAEEATGVTPTWMTQIGAFSDGRGHPSESDLSVAYVALIAMGEESAAVERDFAWFSLSALPSLPERHEAMVQGGVTTVRDRLDLYPVAFKLLPSVFTLSELQQIYELLLGRRLHKASFRRALQAAWLVEPTDEWRSEGRGRPAQLYRYAPKKRKRGRRGVRFDLL
jgi:8-oxo-dGTP diphosphatase